MGGGDGGRGRYLRCVCPTCDIRDNEFSPPPTSKDYLRLKGRGGV